MMYVMLLIGFFLLIKGADYFVEGSSSIAKLLRVPTVIIGLTVVAMGTSAPELAVSITAAASGNNAIALSNVLGSNLFNLLVVAGACAAVIPLVVAGEILRRDFPFSTVLTAILLLLCIGDREVGRLDGCLLFVILIVYLYILIRQALKQRQPEEEKVVQGIRRSPAVSVGFILGGITAIVWGGDLVVDNASRIAERFGLSQTLIGLTIVAMGTSLPELVTSVVAARKGEKDMAMGNVIGSNLFNLLAVLGLSAAIHPVRVEWSSLCDMGILLGCSAAVWLLCRKSGQLNRGCGLGMLAAYAGYTAYIIVR